MVIHDLDDVRYPLLRKPPENRVLPNLEGFTKVSRKDPFHGGRLLNPINNINIYKYDLE